MLLGGKTFVKITPPPMRCCSRGSLPAELPPLLLKKWIGAPVVELQLAAAAAAAAVVPLAQMLLLLLQLMMFPVTVVSGQSLGKRSFGDVMSRERQSCEV